MGWVVKATPRPLYTPRKTRYPLYRRLGEPQDRYGRVRKISPPPGFDPRTVQPVIQSLYRLCWKSKDASDVQPQPNCFVRKYHCEKYVPILNSQLEWHLLRKGRFQVPSPTQRYSNTGGHVHSQLKCTEDGISIAINNCAQFGVTDVHYDKDFSVA